MLSTSLIFDRSVEGKISDLASREGNVSGLLIGQRTDSAIFVVHLARTLNFEQPVGESQSSAPKRGSTPRRSANKNSPAPQKVSLFDDQASLQHVRQTVRMLPGGMDIVGIFFVGSAKTGQQNVASFHKLLRSAYKVSTKVENACGINSSDNSSTYGQMILLSIEPPSSNKKLVSATLLDCRPDVESNAPSTTVPVSYQNLRWRHISTRLIFDVPLFVAAEQAKESFLKQFTDAVRPWCRRLWAAGAAVNGSVRDGSEPLVIAPAKGSKGKASTEETDMDVIDLYFTAEMDGTNGRASVNEKSAVSMHVRGGMYCLAIVHQKASVGEAIRAVKVDALRSLFGRCELHYDGMAVLEGEELDPIAVHQFPRRVFAPITNSGIVATDYLFEGDVSGDVVASFKELLDSDVTQDMVQDGIERVPSEKSLEKLLRSSVSSTPAESVDGIDLLHKNAVQGSKRSPGNMYSLIYAVLAIIVAILAYLGYVIFGKQGRVQ